MDTLKCKVFLEAARLRSFAAAARALGYTTPNVSHIIGEMEKELGVPLFYRKHAGVILTANGERFIPLAKDFLAGEERMLSLAGEIRGLVTGTVRIGAYPSIVSYLLPPVIRTFRDKHPGVKLEIEERYRRDALSDLEQGFIDLAILSSSGPLDHERLQWIPLYEDDLVAVLPKDHRYAGRKSFPRKALADEPFTYPGISSDDNDAGLFLEQHGIEPNTVYSALSNAAALGMVKEGLGISLLYRLSTTHWENDVTLLKLDPPQKIELGIAVPDGREFLPGIRHFIDTATGILAAD